MKKPGDSYIKIYRKLLDRKLWMHPVKMRIFMYLLLRARYKKQPSHKYNSSNIIIKRGQYLRSYRNLRDDLKYYDNRSLTQYSLSTLNWVFSELEDEGMIKISKTPLGTLFTIVNYDSYQGSDNNAVNTHKTTEQPVRKAKPKQAIKPVNSATPAPKQPVKTPTKTTKPAPKRTVKGKEMRANPIIMEIDFDEDVKDED